MTKKKIVSLSLVIALLATLVVGGTMAYFTDKDNATNVFTVGNVSIDLVEDFGNVNEDGTRDYELMPGKVNAVNKDVHVDNTGDNPAWVRVKVYIPSALDQLTTPQYTNEGHLVAAAFNTLHMNTAEGAYDNWAIKEANEAATAVTEGDYAGCNEYIFYYKTPVAGKASTDQLLDQFYLDETLNYDEDGWYVVRKGVKKYVDYDFSKTIEIPVIAEAIQAEGFATYEAAFVAFDAQK